MVFCFDRAFFLSICVCIVWRVSGLFGFFCYCLLCSRTSNNFYVFCLSGSKFVKVGCGSFPRSSSKGSKWPPRTSSGSIWTSSVSLSSTRASYSRLLWLQTETWTTPLIITKYSWPESPWQKTVSPASRNWYFTFITISKRSLLARILNFSLKNFRF